MSDRAAPPAAAPATTRELRRGQIIKAARALAAGSGLESLTIEALEKRLGFSRGVITYHFRGKDEILEALLDDAVAEIGRSIRDALGASSPDQRLRAVLSAVLRGFLERRDAVRVLLSFWGRIGADPRIRRRNARLYALYRRQSALLLTRPGARPGARERALAAVLVGIVIGLVSQDFFEAGAVDVDAALEQAVLLVSR